MPKKRGQAAWLSQILSEWARAPVTVAWEAEGVGRGDWWVRWSDGPTVEAMRAHARSHGVYLRPLDVTALRFARDYSPRAWAVALLSLAETQPEITDWHELLGVAESWLDDAEQPDDAGADDEHVAHLVAVAGGREAAMARAVFSARPQRLAVTQVRDEPVCPVCGAPVPRAGAGRPGRYCSPACRTRAWRRRSARAIGETKTRDETRCPVCGASVPRAGVGRPARYCSPACRTRAWRQRPRHRDDSDTTRPDAGAS
ncbi:hypothetical protein ACLQ24_29350 [Micromonospora sp. DT4]|uniref:hypothetical protein n=1 Tax=Micromonospora sp. DT4 TaxID=3393438 RepID=UPI003CEBEFA5